MLHRIAHRLDALGDQGRMGHQAGADHVVLHPVTGATDVQVDLVVTGLLGEPRASSQIRRIAAAQLQGERMLGLVVMQKPLGIAVQQRTGGDHLGIQQCTLRQLAQKIPAVVIGPVHHRRHGEAAGEGNARIFWFRD